jgi:ribosomal protein S19E (S16A)
LSDEEGKVREEKFRKPKSHSWQFLSNASPIRRVYAKMALQMTRRWSPALRSLLL